MKRQHMILTGLALSAALGCAAWMSRSAQADPPQQGDTTVYELRTYTTNEGRLPALHKRFRDHTMRIFEKHGIKNIGYWTPLDKENTLVYIIAHKSREAADKSWAAFRDDPQWKKAYQESIADGKIVKKVERQFLSPTDYSPLK